VCVATHTCKRRTASGRTARRTNHYSGLVGRRGPKAPPYVGPCRVQGDPAYEPIEQLSAISESYWPPPIFPSSKMPCDLIHWNVCSNTSFVYGSKTMRSPGPQRRVSILA